MKTLDFKNKKVAVLGLGMEGISNAEFFTKKSARVTILDQKDKAQIEPEYLRRAEKIGAGFVFGKEYLKELDSFDLIVRSPGVSLDQIPNDKITSQTEVFFDLCPCKIIGITGTKGKGTTASLIHEMLIKEEKDAYLVGNIGKPAFDILSKLSDQSIVVYELSSFQLQGLKKSPHIAVMLMVTSEHLDYHKNQEAYVDAKRNIFRFQNYNDFAIVNRDYPASNESDAFTQGKIFQISREQEILDNGCYVRDQKIFYKIAGLEEEVIDCTQVCLLGKHNWENICAAVAAAKLSGASNKNIREVLKTFKGLEHRLELVDTIQGIRYYDDSFSTTPETAIAAIESFVDPEILILGGSSKNSNFKELGEVISKAENIKAIIGIGVEWQKIKSQIKNFKAQIILIEGAKDMETVVKAASRIAETGDVVLLTPACASFDMFKNYKDRGDQFKKGVKKLRENLN